VVAKSAAQDGQRNAAGLVASDIGLQPSHTPKVVHDKPYYGHVGDDEAGERHFRLSPLFFIVSKERAARNYSVKVKKTGLFHIILYFWTYGA
jgi:hypothetical protein